MKLVENLESAIDDLDTEIRTAYKEAKERYGCTTLEELKARIDTIQKAVDEQMIELSKRTESLHGIIETGMANLK
jgi:hypothetical protein